jgi:hypothetical protein
VLSHAIGAAGPDVAAATAVVLTLGTTNAYINGAAAMAGHLAGETPGSRAARPLRWLLAAVAAAGLLLISLYGLGIVSTAALVTVPTALFLAVYLGAMVAAARALRGPVRLAALPAALAVIIVLGFCGWALITPAAVTLTVGWRHRAQCRRRSFQVDEEAATDWCQLGATPGRVVAGTELVAPSAGRLGLPGIGGCKSAASTSAITPASAQADKISSGSMMAWLLK